MWAAWRGSGAVVDRLLDAGADVAARTTRGRTVLDHQWAEKEAPRTQPAGQTALAWAAERGHDDVVRRLLAAGAVVDGADDAGRTPLMAASTARVIALLVDAGANLESADRHGRTPLIYAAAAGKIEAARALAGRGANLNACMTSRYGDTPLTMACGNNDHAMARALLELGADVNGPAVGNGSPLAEAACMADADMVRLLLAAGADVNSRDYRGKTPLLSALRRMGPKEENARVLLEAGADAGIATVAGETALMAAAGDVRVDTVRALLRTGRSDVNAQDKNGDTALHGAIVHGGVRAAEVVRVLLEAGARVDLLNRAGATALDEAIHRKAPEAVLELLRAAGAVRGASDGGAGG